MKIWKTLQWVGFLLLIVGFIKIGYMYGLKKNPEKPTKTEIIYKTDTITISKFDTIQVEIPTDSSLQDSLLVLQKRLLKGADTIIISDTIYRWIAKDYYSIRTYDSTLINSDSITARIIAKITQNKLSNLQFQYNIPIRINNTIETIENPHFSYYGGLGADLSGDWFVQLGVSPPRSRWLFGAGVNTRQLKFISASYRIK